MELGIRVARGIEVVAFRAGRFTSTSKLMILSAEAFCNFQKASIPGMPLPGSRRPVRRGLSV
jgi:hypothetical protein